MAPVQVKVLPITDAFNDYAEKVVKRLKAANIRVQLDDRSEKVGAKIRAAEIQKVPYMFVIGAKEIESESVAIRKHGAGDQGAKTVEESVSLLKKEIEDKISK